MSSKSSSSEQSNKGAQPEQPPGMNGAKAGFAYVKSVYLHPEWFGNLTPVVEHQGFDVQTPCVESDGLCLPLMRPRKGLGQRLRSLSNYYSSLYGIQGSRDDEADQPVVDAMVRQLTAAKPGISSVDLEPMSQESTDYKQLQIAFEAQGWWVKPYFCFGNWYMPTEGLRYEEYAKSLSSRVRNTARRKRNKFLKMEGARLTLYTEQEGCEVAIDAFQKIYMNSWKVEEPYPEYIREFALWCARNGWLRMGVAWLGETPVAAQFWFVNDGIASIFKLAYDEEYKSLSTGTLLTVELMQHVLDVDQVEEIDYLTGDDPYKKEWLTHRRERWGLLAINPRTVVGMGLFIRHSVAAFLKRFR